MKKIEAMIPVPAGSFQRDEGEANISVITKPYYMSKCQITRQHFKEIMGKDPSETLNSIDINDPVQMVSWHHAITFCNKLSLEEGLEPAYSVTVDGTEIDWANLVFDDIPTKDTDMNYQAWKDVECDWTANGYRLPTEMEWMWAAMGANKDARADAIDTDGINRTGWKKGYAGSTEGDYEQENLGDYAWFKRYSSGAKDGNSDCETHPVGEKKPNELGLYDMSGNVWEWCWDWSIGTLDDGTLVDYRGAEKEELIHTRVARGGSFDDVSGLCTIKNRYNLFPYVDYRFDFGFRVARNGE